MLKKKNLRDLTYFDDAFPTSLSLAKTACCDVSTTFPFDVCDVALNLSLTEAESMLRLLELKSI